MKIAKSIFYAGALLTLLASGCSKSVTKEAGGSFRQIEVEPTPTATVSPEPSPSPSASPTPEPAGCDPSRLSDLSKYAIFTAEELKLSHAHISKQVIASDAVIDKSVIGFSLSKDATRADLQTAMDLDVQKVKVRHGKATYGRSLHSKKSSALGGFTQAPISLVENLHTLSEFSDACAKRTSNTVVTRTCVNIPAPKICTLRITGTDPNLNIAEITPEMLQGTHVLRVNVPSGSVLVANAPEVQKTAFNAVVVAIKKRAKRAQVYWNFPSADELDFKGTIFRGTVVAPGAAVTVKGQAGKAAYWTRSLTASRVIW